MTALPTQQDDDICMASLNDPCTPDENTKDPSRNDDSDIEQGIASSTNNIEKETDAKFHKNNTSNEKKINANSAGPTSIKTTDNDDGNDDHTTSNTKNDEGDIITPPNGKYFAYITLFILFIDFISAIQYIPAMNRVGFSHFRWNANPRATIYDADYLENSGQLDPELSARRALNAHVLGGFSLLTIAAFQITLTFFFRKKQQTQNNDNNKNDINSMMRPTSSWQFCLSDTTARMLHRFVGRTAAVLWVMIYCTGIVYYFTATTHYGFKDQGPYEKLVRFSHIFLRLYPATHSLVNVIIGVWAVAAKNKVKDYMMLHKSCMAFALISLSGIAYGKILTAVVQSYIGRSCLLSLKAVAACILIGYIIHFLVVLISMHCSDRRLFKYKFVQWNLIGYSINIIILFIGTLALFLDTSSADEGCY